MKQDNEQLITKAHIFKILKKRNPFSHKGDFGKEPMIIVFGETPDIIIKKIMKII